MGTTNQAGGSLRAPALLVLVLVALLTALGMPVPPAAAASSTGPGGTPPPASGIAGVVSGPAGAKTGVLVEAWDNNAAAETPAATATSGEGGAYALDVPTGEYRVVATPPLDDPANLAQVSHVVLVPTTSGAARDITLLVGNVRGTVRWSDGTTATAATVEAVPATTSGAPKVTGVTYEDGSYRLALPAAGSYTVTAIPPAANPLLDGPGTITLSLGSDNQESTGNDVALQRPTLRGTALAPDGTTAVGGAQVRVTTTSGGPVTGGSTVARGNGEWALYLPAASYHLHGDAPLGNPNLWLPSTVQGVTIGAEHTTEAPATASVRLREPVLKGVARTPTGEAVPYAPVHAYHPATGELIFPVADGAGRYMLGLPTGDVRILAYPPAPTIDYVSLDETVNVPVLGTRRDVVFPATNVKGTIVAPDGSPAPGAGLQVYPEPGSPTEYRGHVMPEGRFGYRVSPGSYRLVAFPPEDNPEGWVKGAQTVTLAADQTALGLTLALGAGGPAPYSLTKVTVERPDGWRSSSMTAPDASADGSVIAASARLSRASDSATTEAVVVHHMATGVTELILGRDNSVPMGYLEDRPAISADGDVVVFRSSAPQFDPAGAEDTRTDLFVHRRSTATTLRIAVPDTRWASGDDVVAVSDDGRTLAFTNRYRDPDTWDERYEIDVVRLDVAADGAFVVGSQETVVSGVVKGPVLSADGNTLAWNQWDDGPGWTVQVRDLTTGIDDQPLVSFAGENQWWRGEMQPPALSADGSVLAFLVSTNTPTPEGWYTMARHAHLLDRTTGTGGEVQLFPDGATAGTGAEWVSLSADGATLAVASEGAHPEEDEYQAWVHDRASGETTLVSENANRAPADRGVWSVSAGASGAIVAFETDSTNLSAGDEGDYSSKVYVGSALESEPPVWPEGSALTADASDIGETSARVRWTAATDNHAVKAYRVYVDGVMRAEVTGLEALVTGLTPDTVHQFQVQAVDTANNESRDGPVLAVRTQASNSGALVPLSAVASAGGTVSLEWEQVTDSAVTGLVVRRSRGTEVVTTDIPATATTHVTRGLAADTTYTFQVLARWGTGSPAAYSHPTDVTTAPLALSLVDHSAPLVKPGLARLGTDARIVARGEPGRTMAATVSFESWYDTSRTLLEAPAVRTALVPLPEDSSAPGVYRGTFPLAEGTAKVVGVTATISDGHGGELSLASTRPALSVSGALRVTVDAPEGSIPRGWLQVSSAATGFANSRPIDGGAIVAIDDVFPSPDLSIRVVDEIGRTAVRADGVEVPNGRRMERTVTPRLPASLTVRVVDAEGAPVTNVSVEATAGGGQRWLGTVRTASDGTATIRHLQDGEVVTVRTLLPPGSLLVDNSVETTLSPGTNAADLVLASVARTQVTGVVTYDEGDPAIDASVVLMQTLGGVSHTFTAQTDAEGRYTVRGIEGPAKLTAVLGTQRAFAELAPLSAGEPSEQNVVLSGKRDYRVMLRVFTKYPDSPETMVSLDWRVAVHLGMHITVAGSNVSYYNLHSGPDGSPIVVGANPGDQLKLCIAGWEAGLRPACSEIALATDRAPAIELHAGPASFYSASIVDQAGAPITSGQARLFRVDADGRRLLRSEYTGGNLRTALDEPGDYAVEVVSGLALGSATFSSNGSDVDGGTIVVREGTTFLSGESTVTPVRPDVVPGGDVELRGGWHNTSSSTADDVVAAISVPTNAALVAGSVTVNGMAVTPTLGGGGRHLVPVGDVPAGGRGSVRYRLRVAPDATGTLDAAVALISGHAGGERREEALQPAVVPIVTLTFDVPGKLEDRVTRVSGRAPAGATVGVYDDGALLAEAVASVGGFWSTMVTLPVATAPEPEHRLVARTTVLGLSFTVERRVVVDASRPVLRSVSLYQLDEGKEGRRITFDPRQGVARFPFVFVPAHPTVFELHFDDPARVEKATVVIGDLRIPAVRTSAGHWQAAMRVNSLAGPVYIEQDGIPVPLNLDQPGPTPEQVKAGLPWWLQKTTVVSKSEDAEARTGTFTMTVPGFAPEDQITATLSTSEESYSPTAADLESERRTGVPMWGLRLERTTNGLRMSGLIPTDRIPGASESGFQAASVSGAAAAVVPVVRIGLDDVFNGVTAFDSVLSAWGADEKYKNLMKALDAAGNCSPAKIESYTDRAENLAALAALADAAGAVIQVASFVLAPATLGLTLAVGVAGWVFDKATGYAIDQATQALIADINADPDCEEDDDNDDGNDDPDNPRQRPRPIADPVWIYDPSGFVFEGMTSNRLTGVTATLLAGDTENGPWTVWDADWYGQANPLTTDHEGRYGWDVPPGWWKVAFTKEGYAPAFSKALQVLPPHFDVNVGMEAFGLPAVESVALDAGNLVLTFNRPMRTATVLGEGNVAVSSDGAAVPGTLTPVAAETVDGQELAKVFRFTPATAFPAGSSVTMTVAPAVVDYSGRVLPTEVARAVSVPAAPTPTDPTPTPTDPTPTPGDSTPTPGDSTPTPGDSTPAPGDSTPAPGESTAGGSTPAPSPTPALASVRVGGEHRYATAAAVARRAYPQGAPEVVVAAGHAFPDALAASALTGVVRGPILLTAHDTLPPDTAEAIRSLGATRATIVGGDEAVSGAVEAQLRAAGVTVERVGGADRFETAARAARRVGTSAIGHTESRRTIFLASGEKHPDALVAGPLAAASTLPVFLTRTNALPAGMTAAVKELAVERVIILGGIEAVGTEPERELSAAGVDVVRIGGADRSGTAVALAAAAITRFGFDADDLVIARGDDFPDALAVAPLAAGLKAPLLLAANPTTLTEETRHFVDSHKATVTTVYGIGGPAAVSESVLASLG